MLTREDRIQRTETWRNHCRTFAHLAGVDTAIWQELKLQQAEREAQKEKLLAEEKAIIFDPFVGYIKRKDA